MTVPYLPLDHPEFTEHSAATRLLVARRNLRIVTEKLATETVEHEAHLKRIRDKEVEYREKDRDLKQQLQTYNTFLRDTDARIKRAEAKAIEEANQIKQKEVEIKELERLKLQTERELKETVEFVSKNSHCTQYLGSYVGNHSAEQGGTVAEVLSRYAALHSANRDLQSDLENLKYNLEEMKVQQRHLAAEAANAILTVNNESARKQQELEEQERKRVRLEAAIANSSHRGSCVQSKLATISAATDNLLERCKQQCPVVQHHSELDEVTAQVGDAESCEKVRTSD
eukprot:GHVU01021406.1.p2 GENE.GHVU01021406.1~~GHVU01021406.1.p2  ORF type:complete len:285 (+),score=53.68 GHVU01021406.1:3634-4488(+)